MAKSVGLGNCSEVVTRNRVNGKNVVKRSLSTPKGGECLAQLFYAGAIAIFVAAAFALSGNTLCSLAQESPAPVPLIFDTDMGNDVDDAMALAVIHALQSRNECQLLAVTLTKDNVYAARFVELMNTFYGRPEIPIGMVRGGSRPEEGDTSAGWRRQKTTANFAIRIGFVPAKRCRMLPSFCVGC